MPQAVPQPAPPAALQTAPTVPPQTTPSAVPIAAPPVAPHAESPDPPLLLTQPVDLADDRLYVRLSVLWHQPPGAEPALRLTADRYCWHGIHFCYPETYFPAQPTALEVVLYALQGLLPKVPAEGVARMEFGVLPVAVSHAQRHFPLIRFVGADLSDHFPRLAEKYPVYVEEGFETLLRLNQLLPSRVSYRKLEEGRLEFRVLCIHLNMALCDN